MRPPWLQHVGLTGKGGRYKYYKFNGRVRKCDRACPSKNFPLEEIASLVLGTLKRTPYTAEHIRAIVDDLWASVAKNEAPDDRIKLNRLEGELKDNERSRAKLHQETRQTLLTEITDLK